MSVLVDEQARDDYVITNWLTMTGEATIRSVILNEILEHVSTKYVFNQSIGISFGLLSVIDVEADTGVDFTANGLDVGFNITPLK